MKDFNEWKKKKLSFLETDDAYRLYRQYYEQYAKKGEMVEGGAYNARDFKKVALLFIKEAQESNEWKKKETQNIIKNIAKRQQYYTDKQYKAYRQAILKAIKIDKTDPKYKQVKSKYGHILEDDALFRLNAKAIVRDMGFGFTSYIDT